MRAAEVMASLSLATDIAIGVELEHGLRSTLLAMRLADRLGLDGATASETYYACLLFYVGCTADDDVEAEIFGGDLARDLMPATFGSRGEVLMAAVRHGCASGRRPAESAGSFGGCPDGRAGSRRTVFESLRGRELGGGRRAGAEALSCMGTWRGCLGRRAMVRVGPDATENPLARPHTRFFKCPAIR